MPAEKLGQLRRNDLVCIHHEDPFPRGRLDPLVSRRIKVWDRIVQKDLRREALGPLAGSVRTVHVDDDALVAPSQVFEALTDVFLLV
jgi:hypothetical protein